MTEQELRNIPIGGDAWYFRARLCNTSSVRIRHNDKPKHLRKVETEEKPLANILCTFVDDNGERYGVYYKLGCDNIFTDEKSAWESYSNKVQKMIAEVKKRKREYCKVANDTIGQLQNEYIVAVSQHLNGGDADAV